MSQEVFVAAFSISAVYLMQVRYLFHAHYYFQLLHIYLLYSQITACCQPISVTQKLPYQMLLHYVSRQNTPQQQQRLSSHKSTAWALDRR